MSSTIGKILKMTIFGESHSKAIGLTLEGLPSGLTIDEKLIKKVLSQRNPKNELSTSRHEEDKVEFISGVFNNKTTGAPLTFIINNKDTHSEDYINGQIRPGHSDLTNYIKFDGNNDYRGGGFSSGRITASIVVAGAILRPILDRNNIKIASHINMIHGVFDDEFDFNNIDSIIEKLNNSVFPVINEISGEKMKNEILNAKENNDSVGGMLESCILGLPIGLGEPHFDSLESYISQLLFSIGGVKGVQFGDGCKFAKCLGSEVKDEIRIVDEKVCFLANHNGGINGGLSNGQPVIIKTTIKAPSSIGQLQQSINLKTNENIDLSISGRHDACIVHRVRAVVDALLAFAVVDLLMVKKSREI